MTKAWELVEQGWVQGFSFGDEDGRPCRRDNAVKFCALGAIERAYPNSASSAAMQARNYLYHEYNNRASVSMWNDDPQRTQADVVRMLKGAGV